MVITLLYNTNQRLSQGFVRLQSLIRPYTFITPLYNVVKKMSGWGFVYLAKTTNVAR